MQVENHDVRVLVKKLVCFFFLEILMMRFMVLYA